MSLNLYGEPIEQVDKVKLLATIIDSQLSWSLNTLIDGRKKMDYGISMVRKCLSDVLYIVGQVAKSLIYVTWIIAPVWSSASKGQLKK